MIATLASRGLDCRHFDNGSCRSCEWLDRTYTDQLAAKGAGCRDLLAPWQEIAWEPPIASATSGFRNKAKMVVAGTVDEPRLGILDGGGRGVDLQDCPLHEAAITAALPVLAEAITRVRLVPYDVSTRHGELKHLLVTASPDGELMVRFVLRSQEAISRLRKDLGWLRAALPAARVVSVNLQPEPKAVLEGPTEIVLSEQATLLMRLDVDLHLQPQSFFQTNTAIARRLYDIGRAWVEQSSPERVWDLYCGVGGFALHVAGPERDVLGVEVSAAAIDSARRSAAEAGVGARFEIGDATALATGDALGPAPDLVILNPPRRGIGEELAGSLDSSGVETVVYSSCNARSLARDLAAMPSLRPVRARVLDMFPHTAHYEVITLLRRD